MTRTYDRDTVKWDAATIQLLVEDQRATAYPTAKGTIYVVKLGEGGSVKVTPDMITNGPVGTPRIAPVIDDDEDGERAWVRGEWECEAERLVEAYLTALHGPAENRDGEFDDEARDLVQRLLAQCGGPLWESLKAQTKEAAQKRIRSGQTAWMTADEEDEVLRFFGI